jgi:hypothetical protein
VVEQIQQEVEYIVVRDRTHMNSKLVFDNANCSCGKHVLQSEVVVNFPKCLSRGVCVFQVVFLKRFFEVRRVI